MTSVLRSILPGSSSRTEDFEDDYNAEYSFAIEYNGPPVNRDIPQIVPIDVRRIPTASVASSSVVMKNLSLPIIQPIVKSDQSSNKPLNSAQDSGGHFGNLGGSSARVCSTSSGTSGFFDCRTDSVSLDGDSKSGATHREAEDLDDESGSYFSCTKSRRPQELSSEISSDEPPSNRGNRAPAVTFRDLPSSDDSGGESEYADGPEMYPERPVVSKDGKKGLCYKCGKTNRFSEKEICIVCGAKYCRKCVFRAMGCMPEGRKCITCIGYRIDESKRGLLGKCSRMLKKLVNDDVLKRIMSAEVSCEVNQLPPHLIFVNGKPLSIEELVCLQRCVNPPKKLKPGKYWYDKVSGLWGKDGEKPSQIISPQLALGYQIMQGASNGDTNVVINNREITKPELWMLQAAGINCDGNPHFWVTADGSVQHEGMKNVLANLWEKEYRVKVEEGKAAGNDGKPSSGPVYRCIYAKDGLLEVPHGLESPWDFFRDSLKRNPSNQMLGCRQIIDGKAKNAYSWLTYKQVYDAALKIGSAIRTRCVNPGDKCGIYGANCPEWIISMQACNSHAITYVPLYDTLGANAVEFIINHAEISIAFVQESKLQSILTCLPKCTSHLKTIVSFGKISDDQKTSAEELGVACFSWDEFSLLGNLDDKLPPKKRDEACTIMYTSGTTGEPKGVVLSNVAFMAQVLSIDLLLRLNNDECKEDDVYFSFLPLAHIFDQTIEAYLIYRGSSIGYWQGDVKFLIEDLLVLRPTVFCGVPRIFERIHTGIMDKISGGGLLKTSLFQLAYYYKLRNLQKGLKLEEASPLSDKLVFDKIKQGFGGRVRLMFSGAAPLPQHVEEFVRVACCCLFSQGYGLTESCAGCFTSIADVHPMMGTVGVPMPAIEARLESIPEMGYDALSSVPRGEICIRGKTLFSGYYKRPDLTQEVVVDGWFHTGDVGEWQPNGVMKIIDRKKNIFKLSQGEYVAVESIESVYSQCPLIASVWVYGDSFESFLVAVVVPEKKALEDWAAINQEKGDFQFLCSNTKARKYILDELNNTARRHNLRGFEMIRAVHLEPVPFDIDRDLITPTFKLKRPQLYKYYKDCIGQLYAEAKGRKQ